MKAPFNFCRECFFTQGIRRVFKIFGSENVLVFHMQAQNVEPRNFWNRVAAFLELPPYPDDIDIGLSINERNQAQVNKTYKTTLREPEQARALEYLEQVFEEERRDLVSLLHERGEYIPESLRKFIPSTS